MIRACLSVVVLLASVGGQAYPFPSPERLVYTAGFRLFTVGTSTMELSPGTQGDAPLHIVFRTETLPLFDRLYRIRDRTEVWLDPQSLSLRRMEQDIQEGRYRRQDTTIVDPQRGTIVTRRDTLAARGPVFDPVGAIYHLRGLPLAVGDEIRLSIFNGRRLQHIGIEVAGLETVRVPAGEFQCLVLKPAALDERPLTKVGGLLHLWLSADESHTPVRMEQKMGFGTLVLKLREVN